MRKMKEGSRDKGVRPPGVLNETLPPGQELRQKTSLTKSGEEASSVLRIKREPGRSSSGLSLCPSFRLTQRTIGEECKIRAGLAL
jgi:hypothetical protein